MWTENMVSLLNKGYSTLPSDELCQKLGKTWAQIMDKANRLHLKRPYNLRRKFKINESYFDKIDSNDKAYFLGLLFADGYNNVKYGFLSISLHEKDKEILEELSKRIYVDYKDLYTINGFNNTGTQKKLCVSSKKLSNSLNKFGCSQRKSLDLLFPNVPSEYVNSFIRGYFDGDGCIYIDKHGTAHVTILSTKPFCEELNNKLDNIGNIYPTKCPKIFVWRFGGNGKARKLYYKMYNKGSLCLKRKKEKFLYIM